MENNISRIVIGSVVKNALKNIKENPERSIRNLIDMALQFPKGRFQQKFFSTAQQMLQNENSAYYALVRDTVAYANTEQIYTFSMNLGYNSCTAGAHLIRKNEKKMGFNIPWTILLQLDTLRLEETIAAYQNLIQAGKELGIYTWMIFAKEQPGLVLPLVEEHPDCAFFLFCEPDELTSAFLDSVSGLQHLMLTIHYNENSSDLYSQLHKRGLLYSVWYSYNTYNIEEIVSENLFFDIQQLSPVFTALLPEPDCPSNIQVLAHQTIENARNAQNYRTILWEMRGDTDLVDTIISDDSCSVCFDKNGFLKKLGENIPDEACNLFENSLTDILKHFYTKNERDGK